MDWVSDNFRGMGRDEVRLNWEFLCGKVLEIEAIHQCVGPWRGCTCVLCKHWQLSLPLLYVLKQNLIAGELKIVITRSRFVLRILLRHRPTHCIFECCMIICSKCRLHFLYFIEHALPQAWRGIFKLAFRSIDKVLEFSVILLDGLLVVLLARSIIIIARGQYELCLVDYLVFLGGVLVGHIIYFAWIRFIVQVSVNHGGSTDNGTFIFNHF